MEEFMVGMLELVFGDEVVGPPSWPAPPDFEPPVGDGVLNVCLFGIVDVDLTRFPRFSSISISISVFFPCGAKRKRKKNIEVHIRYDVIYLS